ncbi:hypothetical protein PoB_006372700 [Plakobranchus ocellatus]|uniref:Uncharacterized protein n=1 Tax=Plakobranchus ocellatus TaxID=259542 RepID=A0AAV4CZ43_9GAST|nr:hypothetical protein PoB_006372700 [Plakobranchus ocellatus]
MRCMPLTKFDSHKIARARFMQMFQALDDSVYPCAIRDKGSVQHEVRARLSSTALPTPLKYPAGAVTYTETHVNRVFSRKLRCQTVAGMNWRQEAPADFRATLMLQTEHKIRS